MVEMSMRRYDCPYFVLPMLYHRKVRNCLYLDKILNFKLLDVLILCQLDVTLKMNPDIKHNHVIVNLYRCAVSSDNIVTADCYNLNCHRFPAF